MDNMSPLFWRRGNTWGGTSLRSVWSDRMRELPAARRAPLQRSEPGSDMSHCSALWLLKQVSLFLSTDFFLGRQTTGNKRRPFNSYPPWRRCTLWRLRSFCSYSIMLLASGFTSQIFCCNYIMASFTFMAWHSRGRGENEVINAKINIHVRHAL